ncbi:MAG TPA: GDSL-type esterase/lipase family protein [Nitrospira sp.]|nr:GDSL-type esterase/lipase family protein [Nitrospira sp.]
MPTDLDHSVGGVEHELRVSTEVARVRRAPSPAASRVKRHPWFWLGVLFLLQLVFLFGLAEFVASFFLPPGLHYRNPQPIMEPHPARVYTPKAHQRAFTIDRPYVTNSLGFRDEREFGGGTDKTRILVLGDSITAGIGVSGEETYAGRLESLLGRRGVPVEVINAGVTGYGLWQEVDLFKEKGRLVKPDVVVLQMHWNDLYPKPSEIVPPPRDISLDERSTIHKSLRVLKRSRVLSFMRERFAALRNQLWPSFDWEHRRTILEGRTTPYLEQAFVDAEQSLADFAALRRDGIVPILLVVPIPMQVRDAHPLTTEFQQRVGALAARLGLRMVDPLPALREAFANSGELYVPWDYEHYAPAGHDAVAGVLERYLLDERLLAPSGSSSGTGSL